MISGKSANKIRSYIHRNSTLSPSRERVYTRNLARHGIPYQDAPLAWETVFKNPHDVVVEIGSGMGEATARFASENPGKNIFAIEVYKPGVDSLLRAARAQGLPNLRICRHDAVEVFERMIPDGSVSGVHVFFPDPWPKRRHRKRRLLQPRTLGLIASRLRDGGYLYVVTDWEDYARGVLKSLEGVPALKNPYPLFAPRMSWRPTTLYETKRLSRDQPVRECFFVRSGPCLDC